MTIIPYSLYRSCILYLFTVILHFYSKKIFRNTHHPPSSKSLPRHSFSNTIASNHTNSTTTKLPMISVVIVIIHLLSSILISSLLFSSIPLLSTLLSCLHCLVFRFCDCENFRRNVPIQYYNHHLKATYPYYCNRRHFHIHTIHYNATRSQPLPI